MARSRRVPDPTQDLRIEDALERLLAALREEDPLLPPDAAPFSAAGLHLARCRPTPASHPLPEHSLIPADGRHCCAKAILIKRLNAELLVNPAIKGLYDAVAKSKPLVDELLSFLAPAIRKLFQAFDAQTAALGAEHPAETRAADDDHPELAPRDRWLLDALRRLDTPTRGDLTGDALVDEARLLLESMSLISLARAKLEARLLTYFASPQFHLPFSGAGRPKQSLLKECARVLRATGHDASEIARLLPSHGEIGATARIHEHLRPQRPTRPRRPKGKRASKP